MARTHKEHGAVVGFLLALFRSVVDVVVSAAHVVAAPFKSNRVRTAPSHQGGRGDVVRDPNKPGRVKGTLVAVRDLARSLKDLALVVAGPIVRIVQRALHRDGAKGTRDRAAHEAVAPAPKEAKEASVTEVRMPAQTTLEESRTNSAKVREAKAQEQERQTGRADVAPER